MKFFIFISLFLISFTAHSQLLPGGGKDSFEAKKKDKNEIASRYFVAGDAKSAQMIDDWGLEAGVRAGIIFKNGLGLGFSIFYLLTNNIDFESEILGHSFLRLAYGGIDLEYNLSITRNSFLQFNSIIGWSFISYGVVQQVGEYGGDWAFFIEPQGGIFIRIFDGLFVGPIAGYRFFALGNDKILPMSELNAPMVGLSFKLVDF